MNGTIKGTFWPQCLSHHNISINHYMWALGEVVVSHVSPVISSLYIIKATSSTFNGHLKSMYFICWTIKQSNRDESNREREII